MRHLHLLLILILPIHLIAQDCDKENWIDSMYHFDASILSLREIYSDTASEYIDSVIVPDTLINKYLGLFSSIYGLKSTTTDSIFIEKEIHVFPNVPYMLLRMKIDTNYSWIKTYLHDSLISGNNIFDSLTSLYDFKLYEYYHFNSYSTATIKTTKLLNVEALVDIFEKIDGLSDLATESLYGDGDDIEIKYTNDLAYVTFSVGWGDCVAGCMNRHFWEFSIKDCQAKFERIYGDPFTSIKSELLDEIRFFPNPVSDKLNIIDNDGGRITIQIYNISGKVISQFELTERQVDLSGLNSGIYMIRLIKNNIVYLKKIYKR